MAVRPQEDEDVKELLEKNLEINEDNNKMLRAIERREKWNRILYIGYWLIIIGSALGVYYFIQPYVDNIKKLFQALPGIETMLKSLPGGER